jgi:hypothetical protein
MGHIYNQKAKIRRIAVQSQPGQIFHQTLSQTTTTTKKTQKQDWRSDSSGRVPA